MPCFPFSHQCRSLRRGSLLWTANRQADPLHNRTTPSVLISSALRSPKSKVVLYNLHPRSPGNHLAIEGPIIGQGAPIQISCDDSPLEFFDMPQRTIGRPSRPGWQAAAGGCAREAQPLCFRAPGGRPSGQGLRLDAAFLPTTRRFPHAMLTGSRTGGGLVGVFGYRRCWRDRRQGGEAAGGVVHEVIGSALAQPVRPLRACC